LILLEDIHKAFDDNEVLTGVDISIGEGETMVILGQSGCGKSVLLKLILRLMTLDRGRIVIDNEDTSAFTEFEMMPVRKKFGMLFQSAALFDSLTVADNVAYMLHEHTDLDRATVSDRVEEVLSHVNLSGTQDMMPADLSGGMKKRVALARALAFKPDYILYDEPTTGLDPLTARTINELIRSTQEQFDVTSIVVTHDLISAFYVGDRFALIRDGVAAFYGTPDEFRNSTDHFIKDYLASGREYD
jgi:phospholipid/cholesterol/gamma-HCH transport system ATP-binding protein